MSLSADSVAYAASAPKGVSKVLSREDRTEALLCANPLCGDKEAGHRPMRDPKELLRWIV